LKHLTSTKATKGIVTMSSSDYVADVELAARRALRDFPAEHKTFQRLYLDDDTKFREVFARKLNKTAFDALIDGIVDRVGQEFINAGIYPLEQYMAPVDAR
jgi:hypothetical protein